jgi:hypothetical protein
MESLEFIFEEVIYKYDEGKIYYKDEYNLFHYFCPVLKELSKLLDLFTIDGQITILEAIVHGCLSGYNDGKKAKVREIKKALEIY